MSISKIRNSKVADGSKPLVCLTAYTAPMAKVVSKHADLALVGDSLGMVLYGFNSTVEVTLDIMIAHGKAVANHASKVCVVVDMPFGSYQASPEQAFINASRIMKETGCDAVKLEGGSEMAETIAFLVSRGIPVMGHIGLQPQSVHADGGYKVKGRDTDTFNKVMDDAIALDKAGVFAMVLECTVDELSKDITGTVSVPTIGIGASVHCDGQILVTEDMLGLTDGRKPSFVKSYKDLYADIEDGISEYANDVRDGAFPDEKYSFSTPERSKPKLVG